ncbi:neuropeptide IMFamide [Galleria mellonella]|uniref:IMFamide n=1 Tax=Galleria mellonella TaxID=7137 RepID=A0A6J1WFC0_GALME|nr:neuropeptide IMFamide [Galleria mellonella]WLY76833.1 IMFamide [Galleria mellonella]
MVANMLRFTVAIICAIIVILSLAGVSEANYKNAPMNGIMFGKRGPSEYDSRGKTFTALCEIATEACQAWFPSQENK